MSQTEKDEISIFGIVIIGIMAVIGITGACLGLRVFWEVWKWILGW